MNHIVHNTPVSQFSKLSDVRKLGFCGLLLLILIYPVVFISCGERVPTSTALENEPKINPDYSGITIPPNIAPLNFIINEKADKFLVKFDSKSNYSFTVNSGNGRIIIPVKKWKKLLSFSKGEDLSMEVYAKRGGQWMKFKTITNHVSKDSIDSYLVYRLLSPGFELWHKMGIYQRNLENFEEDPVFTSDLSDHSCMNCHSFCKNNSNTMMFHLRGKLSGTIIEKNGEATLYNTKTAQTISPAVYPAWHPGGRYIAFSVNQIIQSFDAIPEKKVEVIDTLSDLVLLDTEKRMMLKSRKLSTAENFETFPAWSPDGKYLYYCNAKAMPMDSFNHIRYDLMRVAFDPLSGEFGAIDTMISASKTGKSVSFPRVSPDGKYLMFCLSDYGNFSIWHKESDLYLLNLTTRQISKPAINSGQADSYHQWSSSGRWIVFSSRRTNGHYTRLYFSYFNEQGIAQKPFILPQEHPDFYEDFLKSYNVPELITSKIKLTPQKISETARTTPVNVTLKNIE